MIVGKDSSLASTKHGTFRWNELMTDDIEAAVGFKRDVIGWSFDEKPMPEGTYWVAIVDGEPAAGIVKMPDQVSQGAPPHWMGYLAVDDFDQHLAKAKAAGAELLREPFDMPGAGAVRNPQGRWWCGDRLDHAGPGRVSQ